MIGLWRFLQVKAHPLDLGRARPINFRNEKGRAWAAAALLAILAIMLVVHVASGSYLDFVEKRPLYGALYVPIMFWLFVRWTPSIVSSLRSNDFLVKEVNGMITWGGQSDSFTRDTTLPSEEVVEAHLLSGPFAKELNLSLRDGRQVRVPVIFARQMQF